MANQRRETVSASFHYLARMKKEKNSEPEVIPFTQREFDALCDQIIAKPIPNLDDTTVLDRVMYRLEVPMERPNRLDDRTIFGVFRGAYSGHAYDNSARGKIPANSVSLRPFHYLLYLGESGRIYIGAQYLGQFGGYASLERAVRNMLPDAGSIASHSFRASGSYYKNAQPTEVRVKFVNDSKSLVGKPTFTSAGVVAFKKISKGDGFEHSVAEGIFPLIGKPPADVKKGMAALLSQGDLMEVNDQDIEEVTVLATVNGRRNTAIHMIEKDGFATKFPLDLDVNDDGHPHYEHTADAMISVLDTQILPRTENV